MYVRGGTRSGKGGKTPSVSSRGCKKAVRGGTEVSTPSSPTVGFKMSTTFASSGVKVTGSGVRLGMVNKGRGDGSKSRMYPDGIRPVGYGVSWDPIDEETMLGLQDSIGLSRPAWLAGIIPEDVRIHAEQSQAQAIIPFIQDEEQVQDEELVQEEIPVQDYSMGHGSGHGLAPGSAHGSFSFDDDEDNSSAEEVSPDKPKKPSKRATKTNKDDPKEGKEAPKEWTVAEEIALCQGWCDVSENSISGYNMKAKGFWEVVIRYFVKETGSTRGYASIVSKWKNRVRPRIDAFCAIIKNIKATHESGTNDLNVYHKACAEYKMIYKGDFNLEHCYNILKDQPSGLAQLTTKIP
ncbi:hypothetical protein Tco_1236494 [Tanacetum coccineum]